MNVSNFDKKLLAYVVIPIFVLAMLATIKVYQPDDIKMFILALGFDAVEFVICANLIKKSGGKIFKGGRHRIYVILVIVVKAAIFAWGFLWFTTVYIVGTGQVHKLENGINWYNGDLIMKYVVTYIALYGITIAALAILTRGLK